MTSETPETPANGKRLTRAGRAADAVRPRTALLYALLGLAAAAGLVLVVYSVTRPEPAPTPIVTADEEIPDIACKVVVDDSGQKTVCSVHGGDDLDRDDLPTVDGDPLVEDSPIVTSPPDDTYPTVTVADDSPIDEGSVNCIVDYMSKHFTPEEFNLYGSGQDGPRAEEWVEVTVDANAECA